MKTLKFTTRQEAENYFLSRSDSQLTKLGSFICEIADEGSSLVFHTDLENDEYSQSVIRVIKYVETYIQE